MKLTWKIRKTFTTNTKAKVDASYSCLKWNLNQTNIARMRRHGQWHGDWGKGTPQLNWVIGIRRARNQTVLSRRKSNRTGLLSFQRPRYNTTSLLRRQQQQSRHQHHRHHNRTSTEGSKTPDGLRPTGLTRSS